jgi:TPR repeat protein
MPAASSVVVRPSATGQLVNFAKLQTNAAQGIADAQYQVGSDYLRGEGVSRDDARAAYWFRKAAADIGPAECDLGYLYETSRGVPKDYGKAAQWYGEAAAPGIANHSLRGHGFPYSRRSDPKEVRSGDAIFLYLQSIP